MAEHARDGKRAADARESALTAQKARALDASTDYWRQRDWQQRQGPAARRWVSPRKRKAAGRLFEKGKGGKDG